MPLDTIDVVDPDRDGDMDLVFVESPGDANLSILRKTGFNV